MGALSDSIRAQREERRQSPAVAGTGGLQRGYGPVPNINPLQVTGSAIKGALQAVGLIPTTEEGAQMQGWSDRFQSAFSGGDGRGMAEAIGQQAALIAPYMAGAGVIKAYHGSPHSFGKFRMDRIGTGEGAQAYGHGLYFADNEGVAQSYRQALQRVDTAPFDSIGIPPKDWNAARMFAQNMDMSQPDIAARDFAQWTGREVTPELIDAFKKAKSPGAMYEVSINANPEDFLDWDAPLSEQKAWSKIKEDWDANLGDPGIIMERLGIDEATARGRQYLDTMAPQGRGEAFVGTSTKLNSLGVPGIKYLDRNSRSVGEGSRNYVVFDENLISIVKKYGIAGAVAAGLLTNEEAQAFMDANPQARVD